MNNRSITAALSMVFVLFLSGCASTSNIEMSPGMSLSDISITNIAVTNQTGKTFEGIIVEDALTRALEKQLTLKNLKGDGGEPAALIVNIIQYEKGNAFARWMMPGLGTTILSIEGTITNQAGLQIASSQATETVGAGGAFTIGAWQRVFDNVAKALVDDIVNAR